MSNKSPIQINLDGAEPPSEGEKPIVAGGEDAPAEPPEEVDPTYLMGADTAKESEAMIAEKDVETEGLGVRESELNEKTSDPPAGAIITYMPLQQLIISTKKLAHDAGLIDVVHYPTLEEFKGGFLMEGAESSGKTMTMVRTIGASVAPSSKDTSTRLPTVIYHTYDENSRAPLIERLELPEIKVTNGSTLVNEEIVFNVSEDECNKKIREIYDKVRDELELCKSEIRIYIRSSKCPSIVLIDIPGLVNGSTDSSIDKTSEDISRSYLQKKKDFSYILCESAKCDSPGMGKAIKLIKNANKKGRYGWKDQIIVVLTKIDKSGDPDYADHMSEDEDEDAVSSPKTSPYYKLKDMLSGNVGGHNKEVFKELAEKSRIRGLRNKDTCSKTTRGLTVDEQVGAEEKWINENIADTDLHDRLGIKAYAKVLDVALLFHLKDYIDDSLRVAKAKMESTTKQVEELGTPPSKLNLASLQKHTALVLENLCNDAQNMSDFESTLQFNGASTDLEKIQGFYLNEEFAVKMIKDAIAASVRSAFKSDTCGQFRLCRFDCLLSSYEERIGYLVAKHFESFQSVANKVIDAFNAMVLLRFVEAEGKMTNLHTALAKALVTYIVEPVLENLHAEVDIAYPKIWESTPTENDADARAQYLKQLGALEKIIKNWEDLKSKIPSSSDNEPKSPTGKQKRKAVTDTGTSEQDGRATRSNSKTPRLQEAL